jgi:two-component system alkaline phosphatase synthesis response regulator PhoP
MNGDSYRILLVDDEQDVLEFLGYNLMKEGYQVFKCNNGIDAIERAKEVLPHLIILDVMMPEMDGIETCSQLREIEQLKNTLIIFLTARSEEYSQIAGFDAGADDYINKPIKPRLLISRVKALLRRYSETVNGDQESKIIELDGITIDIEKYIVIKEGKEISLPKKEFELLRYLSSKPNRVFSREEIFTNVWGNQVVVGDRTIDVHIRKIREKIGLDNIVTIKGVGYKYKYM